MGALLWLGLAAALAAPWMRATSAQPAAVDGPPERDDAIPEMQSADRAVAYLYRLAAADDLGTANPFADRAVLRFPNSAPLWEAVGYVRRGAGNYADALDAYRNLSRLDPGNINGWRGQALMLQRLGALGPAAALIDARPDLRHDTELRGVLAQHAAEQLRFAESVDDRAQREARAVVILAQLDRLIEDAGGELKAARAGEAPPFDRLLAYVMLRREAQASEHYESLVAGGVQLPAYARMQVAIAYARLGRSERAIPILQELVNERPDDIDAQLELFYALVDRDEIREARAWIDRQLERAHARTDRAAELRLQVAAAMVRAYAEHPAQALERLDTLLDEAPFSVDARSARATVYSWRGWIRRALGETDSVLAVAPRNRDARALQVQTDLALDDWVMARRHLAAAVAEDALSDRDAQQLDSRLRWHQRPQVLIESGFGTGTQTSVATNRDWHFDSRVYSAPIEERYRVFGHVRQSNSDISPTSLSRTWGGLGLDALWRGLAASLELAGVSGESAPAAQFLASWRPADGTRIGLAAASSDPDTPARASANGIRMSSTQLSSGYEFNESTGVGFDVGGARFSDGNHQINATARVSQRLLASNSGRLTWNNYLGATHDSLAATQAPYFDPARAASQETELRGEWLGSRDAHRQRALWHAVTVSIGRYQQSGFATHDTEAVRYELRWTCSDHGEFAAGVARSRHPYDGNEESRTSATVSYEGRF